jgi:hypothetical protein
VQFLDDHVKDPKWHLVIQFVAGLVGDKIREEPREYKNQNVLGDIQKRYYIFCIVYTVYISTLKSERKQSQIFSFGRLVLV